MNHEMAVKMIDEAKGGAMHVICSIEENVCAAMGFRYFPGYNNEEFTARVVDAIEATVDARESDYLDAAAIAYFSSYGIN